MSALEVADVCQEHFRTQRVGHSLSAEIGSLMLKGPVELRKEADMESYHKVLDRIASESGLGGFPQIPDDVSYLRSMAEDGPVVYVNSCSFRSHDYRSDAIIITKATVFSIPLPNFNFDSIQEYRKKFEAALTKLRNDAAEANSDYEVVMTWLWEVVARPILDGIDFVPYHIPLDEKPRVFWVTTGWIPSFPIHAAGIFSRDDGQSVLDRVVSSYLPSLRVLEHLRQRATQIKGHDDTSDGPGLIVGMSKTPGAEDLERVEAEVKVVQDAVSTATSECVLMNKTLAQVQPKLQECVMVHFACHAFADGKDPSKSMIQLQDWKSKPLNVRAILQMKVQRCSLAYISACESAASKNLFLLEEGIHIAGAFHMAGVLHTISAFWPVADGASASAAEFFYGALKGEQGRLYFEASAKALRSAMVKLRANGWKPIFWGAYTHSGP